MKKSLFVALVLLAVIFASVTSSCGTHEPEVVYVVVTATPEPSLTPIPTAAPTARVCEWIEIGDDQLENSCKRIWEDVGSSPSKSCGGEPCVETDYTLYRAEFPYEGKTVYMLESSKYEDSGWGWTYSDEYYPLVKKGKAEIIGNKLLVSSNDYLQVVWLDLGDNGRVLTEIYKDVDARATVMKFD